MAQFVNMFDVDLQKPTNPQPLRQVVGEGDANGMRVGANVTNAGAYIALGGSCVGKVVRADGATVQLTGTISGNSAYVVLDQTSCAIEGPISVAVCWVSNSNVTTLVVAYGTIVHTQTGNAIQPSTPVPDLTELLAQISAMQTATAAANAAASNALGNFAGAFSEATAYTVGQYVTYDNGTTARLYRFIADHAAGAWNADHVLRVTVANELIDTAVNARVDQSLSASQKTRARANIEAVSASDVSDAIAAKSVRYDASQSLTDAQKTTARGNIDAGSAAEVDDLKSALNFDEYLINAGEYTIKASDLESGQWSYSSKAENYARARTKFLLPVRAGMVISYENTTFDVYFGVLETPSSGSYIQAIGWKTDSTGTVNITKDGWLTFIIRNHADTSATVNPADFDSVVTIQTDLKTDLNKDIADLKSAINYAEAGIDTALFPFERVPPGADYYAFTNSSGIYKATGLFIPSAKYFRTKFLSYDDAKALVFTLGLADYMWTSWSYSNNSTASPDPQHSNTGEEYIGCTQPLYVQKKSENDKYLIVCFARVDGAYMTTDESDPDSDYYKVQHALKGFVLPEIDKTLMRSDVPADAKTVGDIINAVSSAGNMRTVNIGQYIQGSISTLNGGNIESNTRLRSAGYEQYDEGSLVRVSINPGHKYSIREYSGNPLSSSEAQAVYVGYLPEGETANFVNSIDYYFIPTDGHFYRFVVANSDDSEITPTDASLVGLKTSCLYKQATEVDFEIAGSSLLGNISIRAAKTFQFADGTPPVIDWYLLQDINDNFYMSKDLITKKFLFKFSAPSSTVSNWSCGIDAHNNVIFVKDAAGYTANDGARLDDAKRVNPVYFLASEKYSNVHELDFGNAFKPAGWLQNVGWSVLPNGDVIMCEYTRGTLKTCNVWHIDGSDITDPDNWTVTWSHDIIDTTDTVSPGVKHCHCVQYDPYEDICYFSTGDSDTGSYIYYSTNNGVTWTLAYGPNKDRCRQLNFVFRPDKVYWASDSYTAADKHFFIANRDQNGVIDVANAESIALPEVGHQSCYGCAYVEELNLIVMMDRDDRSMLETLTLKGYDIDAGEIVTLGVVQPTSGGYIGFRTKYVEWYPTGNCIKAGFNPRAGSVNPDTNTMAVCGNLGGNSGNGSTRINNVLMYVYRKADASYGLRFSTIYC